MAIANAPGAGVADDKVVYAFVPEIIKYYLGEDAILQNVPSYLCFRQTDCEYVLANLDKLVVKPANESGGYGILIGPQATPEARKQCAERVKADPRGYMAQPTLTLSTVPTLIGNQIAAPPCGHATLCAAVRQPLCDDWRAHARGTAGGISRRELIPGRRQQGHLDRGGHLMLSRAAENLYWMSRYLERAENTARLINATSQVLLDLPRGATSAGTTSCRWRAWRRCSRRPIRNPTKPT